MAYQVDAISVKSGDCSRSAISVKLGDRGLLGGGDQRWAIAVCWGRSLKICDRDGSKRKAVLLPAL
ncbi:hypothetical protein AB3R30_23435 [Leptolyngbyaceae cyanobacterium UHCC 1019]